MDFITPFLLSIGLSADAFAVSVTDGICSKEVTKRNALLTSLIFGAFQGIMPIIGYYLGNIFYDVILRYHHWVALLLLSALGVNMIFDAIKELKNPENQCDTNKVFSIKNLMIQGIATSIDAMAAGIGLIALDIAIFPTALLIATITFAVSYAGVFLGNKFSCKLGQRAKLIGGIILIVIGCKIFFEHL